MLFFVTSLKCTYSFSSDDFFYIQDFMTDLSQPFGLPIKTELFLLNCTTKSAI